MSAVGLFPILMMMVQWFGGLFAGMLLGLFFYFLFGIEPIAHEPPKEAPLHKQIYQVPVAPNAPEAPGEGMV